MTSHSPFTVTVWDGAFNRLGWIGAPRSLTVTERHNAISTGEITVDGDHHLVGALTTPGTRITVDYGARRVLSGPITSRRGSGPVDTTYTVGVQGDFRVLSTIRAWPVPGNALTNQTSAYDIRAGAAETVLKGFVTANAVTRLGRPLTVATDLGRGSSIKVQMRFHELADRLLPAVAAAGLGVSVVQGASGLVLDVYEPQVYPRTLTVASGVVRSWDWSSQAPTATRVIAGDQGEGTARSFTTTVDGARESAWADVVEVFIDARDTDDATTVAQRRADALAEGAPKSGLRIELAESAGFRYGNGIGVGDEVPIEVAQGVTITDVLAEAVLSWDEAEGAQVTPVIGERTDDPSVSMAKTLAALGRGLRGLWSAR